MNQFAAVTDDPEFCLGTTPLYIDTRNNCIGNNSRGMQEVGKIEYIKCPAVSPDCWTFSLFENMPD